MLEYVNKLSDLDPEWELKVRPTVGGQGKT